MRAQVWPILEYGSGNEPELRLWLANKGVGPALIRHAIVTVDGEPVADWNAAMRKLFGKRVDQPGRYSYSQETLGNRVFSRPSLSRRLRRHLQAVDFSTASRCSWRYVRCAVARRCWSASHMPTRCLP